MDSDSSRYGIVPFMNRKQLAVVSALVGAGGNLGAVIAGFCFYKPIQDAHKGLGLGDDVKILNIHFSGFFVRMH